MALFVVATPIGNPKDFTARALETLRGADLIIGEEMKALRGILRAAGVAGTLVDELNEHSRPADVSHFVNEAREKKVVLVSDCGTPGFCDPGADLVAACVLNGVPVRSVPGPSSLMALLSVCGVRLDEFMFAGFLPAKKEAREQKLEALSELAVPFVVMETPYRCEQLLSDLARVFADRRCVVGLDLSTNAEKVLRNLGRKLEQVKGDHEPIALVLGK